MHDHTTTEGETRGKNFILKGTWPRGQTQRRQCEDQENKKKREKLVRKSDQPEMRRLDGEMLGRAHATGKIRRQSKIKPEQEQNGTEGGPSQLRGT